MTPAEKLVSLQQLLLMQSKKSLTIPHTSLLSRGLMKTIGVFSSHPRDYVKSDTAKLIGALKKCVDKEVTAQIKLNQSSEIELKSPAPRR